MSEAKDDKGDVKAAILGGKKRSPNRLIVDEGKPRKGRELHVFRVGEGSRRVLF